MAKKKDPAVLFYTRDFLVGTMLMSHAQRGMYITLLCLQHLNGHLSEDDIAEACSGKSDPKVMKHFVKDDQGLYYNPRMEEEVQERKKYSENRAKNGKKKWEKTQESESKTDAYASPVHMHSDSKCDAYASANGMHNGCISDASRVAIANAIASTHSIGDSINNNSNTPSLEEVQEYCKTNNFTIDPTRFMDYYKARGWMLGNTPIQDWQALVRLWQEKEHKESGYSSFDTDEFFAAALEAAERKQGGAT